MTQILFAGSNGGKHKGAAAAATHFTDAGERPESPGTPAGRKRQHGELPALGPATGLSLFSAYAPAVDLKSML